MCQSDFVTSQALGGFLSGAQERGNQLQKFILRLLLIDYIERRHGIKLSINIDEAEIDKIIRAELTE